MKKYTHAWLAFMAIKRLEDAKLTVNNRIYADNLISWFKNHKGAVIGGAWYPDSVIMDMANSHVLKFTPNAQGAHSGFKSLPSTYQVLGHINVSPLLNRAYDIDPDDNLPERCESLAHSAIDNLKIQYKVSEMGK